MSTIKVRYLRNSKRVPMACICYKYTANGIELGYSICNPKDKWDRKLGLKIALGRLEQRPLTLKDEHASQNELLTDVLSDMFSCGVLSRRFAKPLLNLFTFAE